MIKLYKNLPLEHVEVAWWLDPEHVLEEDGRVEPLRESIKRKVQIWAPAEELREAVRMNFGSAVMWRYMVVGWHPDADAETWPVRGLQIPHPQDPRECLAGLVKWRDWLEQYGASPRGSLGYTGMCLLKCLLTRDLWTGIGNLPPIEHVAGGRQETLDQKPAHIVGPMLNCDIRAAYANTLGQVQYGGRWDHYMPHPRWEKIAAANPLPLIYMSATVEVPTIECLGQLSEQNRSGPLMIRPRKEPRGAQRLFWERSPEQYPEDDKIKGIWTIEELHAAENVGCKIKEHDVWYHAAAEQPFLRWLDAVHEGRELGGFASTLAKATGNATWGQFAITEGTKLVYRGPKQKEEKVTRSHPSQKAYDLAEYICGSVRAQLYSGMTYAGVDLITAHTDGLWTRGESIPGWRTTGSADEMRIMDAQSYSYRTGDGPWNYVVAGAIERERKFEEWWDEELANGTVTWLP